MSKKIDLNIDLSDVKQQIDSITNKIQNNVNTVAGVGLLGGAGYAGYKAFSEPHSMSGQVARGTGGMIKNVGQGALNAAGMAPAGMTANARGMVFGGGYDNVPVGFDGINMSHNQAMYHGQRDNAKRLSAGVVGSGVGMAEAVGSTAAYGLAGATGLTAGLGALGSGVGSAAASGAVAGAGNLVGGAMGMAGIPGAGAVGGAFKAAAPIAGLAGKGLGYAAGAMAPTILGGMAVRNVAGGITDNVASQRNIEDIIEATGRQFTPGQSTNTLTGEGFGYSDQAQIAGSARESLVDREYLRQDDFTEIFEGMLDNDLLFDVRGANELTERFEEVTDSVKRVARFYQTTLEGATELMGELQQSGFFDTQEQADQLMRAESIGRMTGLSGEEVVAIGQRGAQSARAVDMPTELGYDIGTSTMAAMGDLEVNMEDEQRREFMEIVERRGGREQVAGDMTDFYSGLTDQTQFQAMVFGLVGDDGVDQELYQEVMEGDKGLDELIGLGMREMDSLDDAVEIQDRMRGYYDELDDGQQVRELAREFVNAMDEQMEGVDRQHVLSMLGVDDRLQQQIFDEMLDADPDQFRIASETGMEMHRDEMMRRRSWHGMKESAANWWEGALHSISEPVVDVHEGIMDFTETIGENIRGVRTVDTSTSDIRIMDETELYEEITDSEGGLSDKGLEITDFANWRHDMHEMAPRQFVDRMMGDIASDRDFNILNPFTWGEEGGMIFHGIEKEDAEAAGFVNNPLDAIGESSFMEHVESEHNLDTDDWMNFLAGEAGQEVLGELEYIEDFRDVDTSIVGLDLQGSEQEMARAILSDYARDDTDFTEEMLEDWISGAQGHRTFQRGDAATSRMVGFLGDSNIRGTGFEEDGFTSLVGNEDAIRALRTIGNEKLAEVLSVEDIEELTEMDMIGEMFGEDFVEEIAAADSLDDEIIERTFQQIAATDFGIEGSQTSFDDPKEAYETIREEQEEVLRNNTEALEKIAQAINDNNITHNRIRTQLKETDGSVKGLKVWLEKEGYLD